MKKRLFYLFSGLVMAIALTGTVSNTVTAKSLNDVQVQSGTICVVVDANGDYYLDTSCNSHSVTTRDENGNLIGFKYQDHGTLPANAVRPSKAIHQSYPLALNFGGGLIIEGLVIETITPSGQYKSSFVWNLESQ